MVTAQQLRTDPTSRAGLGFNDLVGSGLSSLEASTIMSGFSGAFGNNAAKDYRAAQGITDDEAFIQQYANPTVTQQVAQNVNNPQTQEVIPIEQQVQANEVLDPNAYQVSDSAPITAPDPIQTAPQVTQTTAATPTPVDAAEVTQGASQAATIDPTMTSAVDPLELKQGEVGALSTIQGQLESLYEDFDAGNIPPWAQGAINKAEETMAARGLGASSIAATAITAAVQQSAIQIAASDASTYFQMDMTNLNSTNTERLENFKTLQQNMLTDVSIDNAAKQFNASSQQQVDQFVAQLTGQIKMQNQSIAANMEQFNAAQANSISAQNAGNQLAVEQFDKNMAVSVDQYNRNMDFQRETFNANMTATIDQSNVEWRRNVNTINTAGANAANQLNVQNAYNMSTTALNNLWQAARDEAAWLFTASENEKTRIAASYSAANKYAHESRNDPTALSAAGNFAGQVLLASVKEDGLKATGSSVINAVQSGWDAVSSIWS